MKDEWLKAAVSDDKLVADVLLRLKDSFPQPSLINHPLPLSWGSRQPRSKPSSSSSSAPPPEKKRETRRSPTTPLDGYEDSVSLSDRFRSKVCASTETPTTTSKRPRRKKTFTELKEEESSLLKERTYLKKELATLRLTLKEQRSMNVNLKRIKLDLHAESRVKSEANSVEERNTSNNRSPEAASSCVSRQAKPEPDSYPAQDQATSQEQPVFVLPDLNMVPDEECMS